MFERILVALDEHAPTGALLCATMAIAQPREACVTVLSVREAPNELESEAVLDLAVSRLREAGYRAQPIVRLTDRGGVADQVIGAIEESRPDLVVMGSRGLSDLHALVVGSVSHRVLSRAGCPVLVVRGDAPKGAPRRLLLAFDDSRHSRRAARVAIDLAKATGAEIEVVAISQPLISEVAITINEDSAKRRVAELVTALRSEVIASGSVKVTASGKAAAIAQTADQSGSDMIVMGTRGLSRVAGAVIGSVSHEVIHLSHRQVLLVP